MKTVSVKPMSTAALTALLACAALPAPAHGSPPPSDANPAASAAADALAAGARRIEGMWDEQVTIMDCSSGAILMVSRGTNLFIRGGALVATNTAPPTTMGPAFGQWWSESGANAFGAKMRLNRFNPDGSFAGIREIVRDIQLAPDADSLTGTVSATDYDPAGNPLQVLCSSEAGTRVPSP